MQIVNIDGDVLKQTEPCARRLELISDLALSNHKPIGTTPSAVVEAPFPKIVTMSGYVPYALENVRPMFDLKNRRFIVTGGAGGIGFATTRAIAEMGGNVVALDIQQKPAEEFATLAPKFGVKTLYVQTDVTKEESLNAAFEQAFDFLGGVDGLVTCAGVAIDKPFVDQTWQEFTRIQEINVSLRDGVTPYSSSTDNQVRFAEHSSLPNSWPRR